MVDANVLVAGSVWARWPHAVLRHALAGDYRLVLSPLVIEEARQRIQETFPASWQRFSDYLSTLEYEEVEDATAEAITANLNLSRDVKDVPVAVVAVRSGVSCLVTSDKDLTESEALKKQVKVVLPAVFLREYMGWSSEQLEAIRYRDWDELE
jgi:predicted nucleic acid-binding protein